VSQRCEQGVQVWLGEETKTLLNLFRGVKPGDTEVDGVSQIWVETRVRTKPGMDSVFSGDWIQTQVYCNLISIRDESAIHSPHCFPRLQVEYLSRWSVSVAVRHY
jgi:hypothetical protein